MLRGIAGRNGTAGVAGGGGAAGVQRRAGEQRAQQQRARAARKDMPATHGQHVSDGSMAFSARLRRPSRPA
ncbi:MAG: hypothetical protein KIT60_09900 [Burkholderiaceae bacterium]|nr:hypothetical protein [Burkholderiaceae bacterium]